MSTLSFPIGAEEIEREIKYVQDLIGYIQRDISIVGKAITSSGAATIDLQSRLSALGDDLLSQQNHLQDLKTRKKEYFAGQPLWIAVNILYTELPSGVLELYNYQTMPLVKYTIFNNTPNEIELFLQSQIEDFSSPQTDHVTIPKECERIFLQLPHLKTYELKKINQPIESIVYISIRNAEEKLIHSQKFCVEFMSRDIIRWCVPDETEPQGYRPLLEHIAAWVTFRNEAVGQALSVAASYLPNGFFNGYPENPDPEVVRKQVKAIYRALTEKFQLTYVPTPFAIGVDQGNERQPVRLPAETLKLQSGNCIDRAVLYASLIECAGLEPVIILLKDHALVGWEDHALVGWKAHKNTEDYEFLETILPATKTFEEVRQNGTARYRHLRRNGCFDNAIFSSTGYSRLMDIKKLHNTGIRPIE